MADSLAKIKAKQDAPKQISNLPSNYKSTEAAAFAKAKAFKGQQASAKAAAEGKDISPADIKNWAREAARREVDYWKGFGKPLQEALEKATEKAPPDIQRQIDADRWAGNVDPDTRWEELQRMGILDYLRPSFIKKYRKAAEKFINTKRGLRAKMSKKKFYQDPND